MVTVKEICSYSVFFWINRLGLACRLTEINFKRFSRFSLPVFLSNPFLKVERALQENLGSYAFQNTNNNSNNREPYKPFSTPEPFGLTAQSRPTDAVSHAQRGRVLGSRQSCSQSLRCPCVLGADQKKAGSGDEIGVEDASLEVTHAQNEIIRDCSGHFPAETRKKVKHRGGVLTTGKQNTTDHYKNKQT